jgi:hypothetical protein
MKYLPHHTGYWKVFVYRTIRSTQNFLRNRLTLYPIQSTGRKSLKGPRHPLYIQHQPKTPHHMYFTQMAIGCTYQCYAVPGWTSSVAVPTLITEAGTTTASERSKGSLTKSCQGIKASQKYGWLLLRLKPKENSKYDIFPLCRRLNTVGWSRLRTRGR